MSYQNAEFADWEKSRIILSDGNYSNPTLWEPVIALFKKRFRNKYINPINKLLKFDTKSGEGFSIVMIQCALIETFAAFRTGKYFRYSNDLQPYEYKDSTELFVNFLIEIPEFKGVFYTVNDNGEKTPNNPFSANDFYYKVRCGLMHETRTKGNWIITSGNSRNNKCIVAGARQGQNQNIIHRDILQKYLENYFNNYIKELQEKNGNGELLRRNLARKFDQLYDIEDRTAEWWDFLE